MDRDSQRTSRPRQLSREASVRGGRPGVAARVVVGEKEARRSVQNRPAQDIGGSGAARSASTLRDSNTTERAQRAVDREQPQLLSSSRRDRGQRPGDLLRARHGRWQLHRLDKRVQAKGGA